MVTHLWIWATRFLPMRERQCKDKTLDVAVIGATGTGKSTFINTFAGLSGREAAQTGMAETTMKVTSYLRIRNSQWPISEFEETTVKSSGIINYVRLWDFPGFDRWEFPEDQYLKTIKEKDYDFYLLLSCDRVRDFEQLIHNFIVRQGKKYVYIRTHFDCDLSNGKRDNPETSESDIKENVTNEIKKQLSNEPEIFFINAEQRDQYDFPKLDRMLVQYMKNSRPYRDQNPPAHYSKVLSYFYQLYQVVPGMFCQQPADNRLFPPGIYNPYFLT